MNIGIVTIYDAFNFGSYLQAYALQKVLEKSGHQVSILNCSNDKFRNFKKIIAKTPSRMLLKLRKFLAYRKAWRELNIKQYKKEAFDVMIIGSDEVWNIKNSTFEHWPEYFGYDLNTKKVIAYAPSCGFATSEDILEDDMCVVGLKKFNSIMARDNITKLISEKITGYECKRVVDPTILYLNEWENELKPCVKAPSDYILYYSYNSKPLMLDHIKQFAYENNFKIVVAGFMYNWCDKSLIVEPKQFLTLIKNARYVVTTTFHGSIFAVVFKKKFIGFYPNKNQKVHDFLYSIGIEDRVYIKGMKYDAFKRILTADVDYEKVFKYLKCEADISLGYLLSKLT